MATCSQELQLRRSSAAIKQGLCFKQLSAIRTLDISWCLTVSNSVDWVSAGGLFNMKVSSHSQVAALVLCNSVQNEVVGVVGVRVEWGYLLP